MWGLMMTTRKRKTAKEAVSPSVKPSDHEDHEGHDVSDVRPACPSASRDWMLTVPADAVDADALEAFLKVVHASGAVYQRERGESTGYEHWQVFAQFASPKRFATLKRQCASNGLGKAHIEPRRGTVAQAVAYCSKEETRVGETCTFGEIALREAQGERTDLQRLRDMIMDGMSVDEVLRRDDKAVAARYVGYLREMAAARDRARAAAWRDMHVLYIYGRPGVGKSRYALDAYPDSYRVTDYAHPFDGYGGQPVLILDEFDGQFDLALLLNLLDGYPMELPCRYANKQALFDTVVIISNSRLETFYEGKEADRRKALYRRIDEYWQCIGHGKFNVLDVPGKKRTNAQKKNNEIITAEDIF